MRPEFVAVDGEAVQDGCYVLMRASTGAELFNPRGISTRQAFEFLLGLKAPNRVLVCFGLNYDCNQWLKDLAWGELRELWETQATSHAWTYKLRWWPRKYLHIKDVRSRRTVEVAEVLGYFQTTFVAALEAWGIGAPAEIARMKEARSTFTMRDIPAIRDYCLRECELLVELMEALADSVYEAGLQPRNPGSARSWIGAGSLASTLLGNHGVDEHHAYDTDIASRHCVETAVLGAMFGGRIEMLAAGMLPKAQTRDIRSAYPHAITQLPSLAGARLKRRPGRAYEPGKEAIWRVSWNAGDSPIVPFPARKPDGTIWYVAQGTGCYHACEVDTAVRLGFDIQVKEGWELVGGAASPGFEFIRDTYRQRAALKRQGSAAEKALKLGLNSCYGKLAQGFGASGKLPRFQSYYWAGQITARTRARLLEAAVSSTRPVMLSTDGIYAERTRIRGTRASAGLGTWEPGQVRDFFAVQPGVYHAFTPGGEVRKSRGFRSREMDWAELRAGYESHGLDHVQVFSSRRFIGLGVSLARNRPDVWRTWTEDGRSLCLYPDRKRVGVQHDAGGGGYIALHPFLGPIDSEPYTPKQDLYDDPTPAKIENMIADDQPDAGD